MSKVTFSWTHKLIPDPTDHNVIAGITFTRRGERDGNYFEIVHQHVLGNDGPGQNHTNQPEAYFTPTVLQSIFDMISGHYDYEGHIEAVHNGEIFEERQEPVTEDVIIEEPKIQIVDGRAVQVMVPRTVKQQVYDEFPIEDEGGAPVMVEAQMEERPKLDHAGDIIGLEMVEVEPAKQKVHYELRTTLVRVPILPKAIGS